MSQLAHDLSLTLLHSLWQSALLLLLYKLNTVVLKKQSPVCRKALLHFMLLTQIGLSTFTFAIYSNEWIPSDFGMFQLSTRLTEDALLFKVLATLFKIYLAILLFKTASLFYHWQSFKVHCQNALVEASPYHRLFVNRKGQELGIFKKVTLWYSHTINSPVTFGFYKPIVLLPIALLNNLSTQETEMLILHELTHIKNNDYVLNFILILSETIFFFNPFVKQLCTHARLEREKNCDVQVVNSFDSSITYAEALLKIATFKKNSPVFQLAATTGGKELLQRVVFFTAERNLRFNNNKLAFLTYGLVILLFVFNFFTFKKSMPEKRNDTYQYFASTIPGYNAFTLQESFADNVKGETRNAPENIEMETKVRAVDVKSVNKRYISQKAKSFAKESWDESLSEPMHVIPATHVSPETTKDFIFNEENSTGSKVTKAYRMSLVNGRWIAEPLWMYTEIKIGGDSIRNDADSVVRPFHIVQ